MGPQADPHLPSWCTAQGRHRDQPDHFTLMQPLVGAWNPADVPSALIAFLLFYPYLYIP